MAEHIIDTRIHDIFKAVSTYCGESSDTDPFEQNSLMLKQELPKKLEDGEFMQTLLKTGLYNEEFGLCGFDAFLVCMPKSAFCKMTDLDAHTMEIGIDGDSGTGMLKYMTTGTMIPLMPAMYVPKNKEYELVGNAYMNKVIILAGGEHMINHSHEAASALAKDTCACIKPLPDFRKYAASVRTKVRGCMTQTLMQLPYAYAADLETDHISSAEYIAHLFSEHFPHIKDEGRKEYVLYFTGNTDAFINTALQQFDMPDTSSDHKLYCVAKEPMKVPITNVRLVNSEPAYAVPFVCSDNVLHTKKFMNFLNSKKGDERGPLHAYWDMLTDFMTTGDKSKCPVMEVDPFLTSMCASRVFTEKVNTFKINHRTVDGEMSMQRIAELKDTHQVTACRLKILKQMLSPMGSPVIDDDDMAFEISAKDRACVMYTSVYVNNVLAPNNLMTYRQDVKEYPFFQRYKLQQPNTDRSHIQKNIRHELKQIHSIVENDNNVQTGTQTQETYAEITRKNQQNRDEVKSCLMACIYADDPYVYTVQLDLNNIYNAEYFSSSKQDDQQDLAFDATTQFPKIKAVSGKFYKETKQCLSLVDILFIKCGCDIFAFKSEVERSLRLSMGKIDHANVNQPVCQRCMLTRQDSTQICMCNYIYAGTYGLDLAPNCMSAVSNHYIASAELNADADSKQSVRANFNFICANDYTSNQRFGEVRLKHSENNGFSVPTFTKKLQAVNNGTVANQNGTTSTVSMDEETVDKLRNNEAWKNSREMHKLLENVSSKVFNSSSTRGGVMGVDRDNTAKSFTFKTTQDVSMPKYMQSVSRSSPPMLNVDTSVLLYDVVHTYWDPSDVQKASPDNKNWQQPYDIESDSEDEDSSDGSSEDAEADKDFIRKRKKRQADRVQCKKQKRDLTVTIRDLFTKLIHDTQEGIPKVLTDEERRMLEEHVVKNVDIAAEVCRDVFKYMYTLYVTKATEAYLKDKLNYAKDIHTAVCDYLKLTNKTVMDAEIDKIAVYNKDVAKNCPNKRILNAVLDPVTCHEIMTASAIKTYQALFRHRIDVDPAVPHDDGITMNTAYTVMSTSSCTRPPPKKCTLQVRMTYPSLFPNRKTDSADIRQKDTCPTFHRSIPTENQVAYRQFVFPVKTTVKSGAMVYVKNNEELGAEEPGVGSKSISAAEQHEILLLQDERSASDDDQMRLGQGEHGFQPHSLLTSTKTLLPLNRYMQLLRDPELKVSLLGEEGFINCKYSNKGAQYVLDYLKPRTTVVQNANTSPVKPFVQILFHDLKCIVCAVISHLKRMCNKCVQSLTKNTDIQLKISTCVNESLCDIQRTNATQVTLQILRMVLTDNPILVSGMYFMCICAALYDNPATNNITSAHNCIPLERGNNLLNIIIPGILKLHIHEKQDETRELKGTYTTFIDRYPRGIMKEDCADHKSTQRRNKFESRLKQNKTCLYIKPSDQEEKDQCSSVNTMPNNIVCLSTESNCTGFGITYTTMSSSISSYRGMYNNAQDVYTQIGYGLPYSATTNPFVADVCRIRMGKADKPMTAAYVHPMVHTGTKNRSMAPGDNITLNAVINECNMEDCLAMFKKLNVTVGGLATTYLEDYATLYDGVDDIDTIEIEEIDIDEFAQFCFERHDLFDEFDNETYMQKIFTHIAPALLSCIQRKMDFRKQLPFA